MNQNKTQYYLDKLQEEASEVIQAVSKIRRFGPDNHHPERTTTNRQELVGEIEDFLALIAALEATQFINLEANQSNIAQKFKVLIQWTGTNTTKRTYWQIPKVA